MSAKGKRWITDNISNGLCISFVWALFSSFVLSRTVSTGAVPKILGNAEDFSSVSELEGSPYEKHFRIGGWVEANEANGSIPNFGFGCRPSPT